MKALYIYRWGPRWSGSPGPAALSRKGHTCELLVRGAKNSALVRFEDGFLAVVSRNALRKAT